MKAALFDWLDDHINPIVVKELRQAVQSRLVVSVLLLFLGVEVFILGAFLLFGQARSGPDSIDWSAGNQVFQWIQGILLVTCFLVPIYTGVRLASERSEHNVDLLFVSALRPRSIIGGKFAAAMVVALLAFSACAPFMTFSYLLRGIDIPTIVLVLALDLLAVIFGTQVALFLGSISGNRGVKFFINLLGYIGLGVLFIYLLQGCAELARSGVGWFEDSPEFWKALGAGTLLTLGLVGLMFCWSVALISPPSANRAPAGRLFLVAVWLSTGVAAAIWSRSIKPFGHHGPVFVWLILGTILVCLQFLISINERERWGPRVARTIPRRWWLRVPAFFFYSGAAGGVLLAVGLGALTLGFGEWWRWLNPDNTEALRSMAVLPPGAVPTPPTAASVGMPGAESSAHVSKVLAGLALFVLCYGLTAVLIRVYLFGSRVRSTYTWLVALLLVGVGSSFPLVLAYLFVPDHLRYSADEQWWLLTNPFASLFEIHTSSRRAGLTDYETMCFLFTISWAGLAAALSMPWIIGQMTHFHRPRARPRVAESVEEALPTEPVVVEPVREAAPEAG
jgi:hypothetical protein